MDELINQFKKLMADLKARLNTAMTGLPPINQFEASSEVANGLRNLHACVSFFDQQYADLEGALQKFSTEAPGKIDALASTKATGIIEQKVTAKEFYSKDEFTNGCTASADAREKTVREEFQKIAARRKEITEGDNKIAPEVANILPDSILLAEDYKTLASKAAARVKDLKDLGIEVAATLLESVSLPYDTAGDTAHKSKVDIFKSVAVKASGGRGPTSAAGGGASNSDESVFAV